MSIARGTRLGPYEVLAPIGAGGMGEVYRARDTRLHRDVALKVLPPSAAGSEESRRRFEREAQIISQLSHPHICAIYDVGTEGTAAYLVMELLEGETLASRLITGPLPPEQVLTAGMEICSALEAAHAKGIVHRDLKPGNVMLTGAGLKLLDFGLAKGLEKPVSPLTDLPTEADDRTATGVVLGTLQYMAPEQLEGRPADARTDVFALGTVLYEMATGRKAFSGPTQASLISAILTSEPPLISSTRPVSPPALDRLVRTCLAKDPAQRWSSAHDVALQLGSIAESARSGAVEVRRATAPMAARLPWLLAGISAAIALATLLRGGVQQPEKPHAIRFDLPLPANATFNQMSDTTYVAVSPDGSQVAFAAFDPETRLWVRPISSLEARPMPGTEGGHSLFFSPDGGSIAFFAAGVLKRVDVAKGSAVPIYDTKVPGPRVGTWGRGGDILFSSAPHTSDAIYRVSASGGAPVPAVRLDRARGEVGIGWPRFLPDGKRFLYFLAMKDGTGTLMLADPGKPARAVMPVQSVAEYVEPGYLVYAHEGTLLGRRFDAKNGRANGAPFSIAPHVRCFRSTASATFAASESGTLVYQAHEDVQRLVWYDRSGRELGTAGTPAGYSHLGSGPPGRRMLALRRQPGLGTTDIVAIDPERGTEERVTSGPDSEFTAIWLPGEKSIVYSAGRSGAPQLLRLELATGRDEELLPAGAAQVAQDVSPDGRTLVFLQAATDKSWWNLWTLSLAGKEAPRLLRSPGGWNAQFSPDGALLAFVSLDTGQNDVYVTPFPGPGERTRITSDGTGAFRWSRQGDELLYLSADGHLKSVEVKGARSLDIGKPTALFKLPGRPWGDFAVSPDGKRILAIEPQVVADELPLTVVVGWPSEVK